MYKHPMNKLLTLHPRDNVALTTKRLANGTPLGGDVCAQIEIPAMHKVAITPIKSGDRIIKYGHPIGLASYDIQPGEHVHTHNCQMIPSQTHTTRETKVSATTILPVEEQATFQGFRRASGRAGTRNFIGILTTVNCSATVAHQIADQINRNGLLNDFPNVDGIVAITHGTGCGMQSSGQGFETLQRTLNGYIDHPNFGAILIVGLGCEVMQLDKLAQRLGQDDRLVRKLNIQTCGGTTAAINTGIDHIRELAKLANKEQREKVPVSELTIALQCGGSDAYSAITANPALGIATDLLVEHGGSAILSETPEIYGAEHLLLERAASDAVANNLSDLISWWRKYADMHGSTLNSNPSPGNLAGGITTILEKSLGAQAKSGTTMLNAVLHYGEQLTSKGLNFMDSPGYDPVSVTGQVASGANIILFTTGRGSAFGFKPVPSIKLATNTALFKRMREDMDLDCGAILEGTQTLKQCGERIFQKILDVASGKKHAPNY